MKTQAFAEQFIAGCRSRELTPVPFDLGFKHRTCFRLHAGLVVILALEVSRARATASWWIGATFLWGHVPAGIPYCAYRRVPSLLSLEERRELIGSEAAVAEGFDYWWPKLDAGTLHSLSAAVAYTDARFLERAPVAEIKRSSYFRERRELVGAVCRRAAVLAAPVLAELHQDRGALAPWLAAAELVAEAGAKRRPRPADVRELAQDAALCAAVGLCAGEWPTAAR